MVKQMGGSGGSAKKKSSRKKSSKISSEGRRRKKSRKDRSKKLRRRRDDSISSYSEDDSMSSLSSSSYSSEDAYRSRKGRSRSRGDVKRRKKRARRRSSSRESSEDPPRVRKRKRSKKNGDTEIQKKSRKKKLRREVSVSSASSDSRSCSTCGGGGSSDESEFEKPRGRLRENKKTKRPPGKLRGGPGRSKTRSPSCSSSDRDIDYNSHSIGSSKEKPLGEIYSRRLKSVITVAEKLHDEEKDSNEEEIPYDHEECPSFRSNDSNGGSSKWYSGYNLHTAPVNRRHIENTSREDVINSDVKTIESEERAEHGNDMYNVNYLHTDRVQMSESENDKAPVVISGSGGDDLESILRQKALENLRRFRGSHQTNIKTASNDKNEKYLAGSQEESSEIEFPKQDGSAVFRGVMDQSRKPALKSNFLRSMDVHKDAVNAEYIEKQSGVSKNSSAHPSDEATLPQNLDIEQTISHAVMKKSNSFKSASKKEPVSTPFSLNQETEPEPSPKADYTATECNLNGNAPEISHSMTATDKLEKVIDPSNSESIKPPTSTETTPEEQSIKDPNSEEKGKDSSEFEQKTMSVMRGGEMVQVSYKVYIPKKAPALSRRRLKR